MNIFQLAKDNSKELEASCKAKTQTLPKPPGQTPINKFSKKVMNDGRIACNMGLEAFYGFLTSGKYMNVYEYADKIAPKAGKAPAVIVKECLGVYHEKRLAFDGSFEQGSEFKYGALNIGGSGATRYKGLSAVIKHEISENTPETTYVKHDSLNHYVSKSGVVNFKLFKKEIAEHTHRKYLSTLKHIGDIQTTLESNWPNMLCNEDDYIEAIFIKEILLDSLEEVRIQQTTKSYYENFAADPDPDLQTKAQVFMCVVHDLKQKGINVKVVN